MPIKHYNYNILLIVIDISNLCSKILQSLLNIDAYNYRKECSFKFYLKLDILVIKNY